MAGTPTGGNTGTWGGVLGNSWKGIARSPEGKADEKGRKGEPGWAVGSLGPIKA